jgi:PhzF family phenazine biosynthesis protein
MPRSIPFFIVDTFTDTPFQGNPAGVFFDDVPANLTDAERMRLCAEVSLESAFVSPGGDGADFRLRYFTGVTETTL